MCTAIASRSSLDAADCAAFQRARRRLLVMGASSAGTTASVLEVDDASVIAAGADETVSSS